MRSTARRFLTISHVFDLPIPNPCIAIFSVRNRFLLCFTLPTFYIRAIVSQMEYVHNAPRVYRAKWLLWKNGKRVCKQRDAALCERAVLMWLDRVTETSTCVSHATSNLACRAIDGVPILQCMHFSRLVWISLI